VTDKRFLSVTAEREANMPNYTEYSEDDVRGALEPLG
jgi:hypothetical protein